MRCPWHVHQIGRVVAYPVISDHIGSYDVCRCGRWRMTGDRRWRRKLSQGNPVHSEDS